MDNTIKVCIDKNLPDDLIEKGMEIAMKENPDNIVKTVERSDVNKEIAIIKSKKWENGRVLRVRFLEGPLVVKEKVKKYAKQWEEYANITFNFGDDPNAEIRIAFDPSSGSWSYIGTDNLAIPQNRPTMNFGWFDENTPDNEYSRTVLHEFGHALGYIHEHQSPAADIPWDKEKVYIYYKEKGGWDKEKVNHNIFEKYSKTETNFSKFDKESIMLYAIPDKLTIGNYEVGWNTVLSENDKKFTRILYPKTSQIKRELVGTGRRAADV